MTGDYETADVAIVTQSTDGFNRAHPNVIVER
jgi:hypothetical protein